MDSWALPCPPHTPSKTTEELSHMITAHKHHSNTKKVCHLAWQNTPHWVPWSFVTCGQYTIHMPTLFVLGLVCLQKIHDRQTFNERLNHQLHLYHEQSNPIFLKDVWCTIKLFLVAKRISSSADIVETIISWYMSPHYNFDLDDRKTIFLEDSGSWQYIPVLHLVTNK